MFWVSKNHLETMWVVINTKKINNVATEVENEWLDQVSKTRKAMKCFFLNMIWRDHANGGSFTVYILAHNLASICFILLFFKRLLES